MRVRISSSTPIYFYSLQDHNLVDDNSLSTTDILNKLASDILVSINPKIIFKRGSQSKAFTATYAIQRKQKEVIIEGSGAHTLR